MRSKDMVDAETDGELASANKFDSTGHNLSRSKEQVTPGDAESESVAPQPDQNPENIDGPKGIRFTLSFTCILLGSFFIGYVRVTCHKRDRQADCLFQDTSCIMTLTPVITDQFHALSNLGWYQIS